MLHAREIFKRLRWPNGVVCPYCGEVHIWHYKAGGYKCSKCGKRFTDTSNTIFHSTKVKLEYWLVAIYLLTEGCKFTGVIWFPSGDTENSVVYVT